MSNVQEQYKTRKRISISLIVVFFGCVIVLGIIAPKDEHHATKLELALFGIALLSGIGSRLVMRCPSCGALLPSSWRSTKFCSRCGEKLVE